MITQRFAHRDRWTTERMDDPLCDRTALERTYAQFRIVNALVAGWRSTYRRLLRPMLRRDRVTTVLDIGSGGGDISRRLLHWARRDGFGLELTAIDPDPRAHAWATRQAPMPGLTFRRALSSDLVAEGSAFDLVISNHLLHHLDEEQLPALLADSQRLARGRAVHSDIVRSGVAYQLFSLGTWPFFHGSFIREDGLVSIRRSFTAEELRSAVPSGWRVMRQAPWRNLLIHDPGTP